MRIETGGPREVSGSFVGALWEGPLSGGHDVGRERSLEGQGPLSEQNKQKQQNQAGDYGKRTSNTGCNQGTSRVDRELTSR